MSEIRKVRERSKDGWKYVTIPQELDIKPGEYVKIEKVDNE